VKRITQLGEPVLRRKTRPISDPGNPSWKRLAREMIRTMNHAQGVGIAAPQVGLSWRLFIVAPKPSRRYPHAPHLPPVAMLNPQLINHTQTMKTDWEGCLSIPGIRGRVPRYTKIQIAYTTPEGQKRRQTLRGFVARIFQHEFDHINGRVFLDRVRDTRTLMTEREYRRALRPK
jgi:peptide deformylase